MLQNLTEFMVYLRELNTASIIVRFLLACVCGGIIGVERGKKLQAAGLRTHLLVCIGATTAMIVNQYIITYLNPMADPGRLGAQVISGIGFLGAGTIMITGRNQIRGLTTAAGLWASACMGLAVGIGFYECAIILCAFLYIILKVLNFVDTRYVKSAATLKLYVEYDDRIMLSQILEGLLKKDWHLVEFEYIGNTRSNGVAMELIVKKSGYNSEKGEAINTVKFMEGVKFVDEI